MAKLRLCCGHPSLSMHRLTHQAMQKRCRRLEDQNKKTLSMELFSVHVRRVRVTQTTKTQNNNRRSSLYHRSSRCQDVFCLRVHGHVKKRFKKHRQKHTRTHATRTDHKEPTHCHLCATPNASSNRRKTFCVDVDVWSFRANSSTYAVYIYLYIYQILVLGP